MWSKNRKRHCSDEELLAYLDRELGRRETELVARHLGTCWVCRSRLDELDQEALNIARLIGESSLSSPARVAELKGAFLDWQRRYEDGKAEGRPKRFVWRIAVVATTAAASLAIAIWTGRSGGPPVIEAAIAAVQASDTEVSGSPQVVRQVIGVRIAQISPSPRQLEGRLEIWSDAPGNRYAEKCTDERGLLKRAVWVTSPQRTYQYEFGHLGSETLDAPHLMPIVELATDESAQIEELFLRWLRNRPWRPVLLSAYFSEFVNDDGVRLLARTEGVDLIRLVAERAVGDATVVLTLDIAASNHRPRLLTLRYESPRRLLEFRLASERLDLLPASSVHSAVFQPGPAFLLSKRELPPRKLPPQVDPAAATRARVPTAELHRVEILYALHQTGACRNEFLDLTREETDRLHLRLIVAANERREYLLAKLDALARAPRLDINIEVRPPPRTRPARRTQSTISPQSSEVWDQAYLHALALVRLAEQLPETRLGSLSQADQHLLELMIRDHLREMRLHLDQVRRELASGQFAAPEWSSPAMRAIAVPVIWQSAVREQFRAIDEVDDSLQELIAKPDTSLSHLRRAWTTMEQAIARMDAVAAGL